MIKDEIENLLASGNQAKALEVLEKSEYGETPEGKILEAKIKGCFYNQKESIKILDEIIHANPIEEFPKLYILSILAKFSIYSLLGPYLPELYEEAQLAQSRIHEFNVFTSKKILDIKTKYLINCGHYFLTQGKLVEAIQQFDLAGEYLSRSEVSEVSEVPEIYRTYIIGAIHGNRGLCYYRQSKLHRAIWETKEELVLYNKVNSKKIRYIYRNLSKYYQDTGDSRNALLYLELSNNLFMQQDQKYQLFSNYCHGAIILSERMEFDRAYSWISKAEKLKVTIHEPIIDFRLYMYHAYGTYFYKLSNFETVRKYFLRCNKMLEEENYPIDILSLYNYYLVVINYDLVDKKAMNFYYDKLASIDVKSDYVQLYQSLAKILILLSEEIKRVGWQFTTEPAQLKLKYFYPRNIT